MTLTYRTVVPQMYLYAARRGTLDAVLCNRKMWDAAAATDGKTIIGIYYHPLAAGSV